MTDRVFIVEEIDSTMKLQRTCLFKVQDLMLYLAPASLSSLSRIDSNGTTLYTGQWQSKGKVLFVDVGKVMATQGPLPNSTTDFWQMVWEQNTQVINMLTSEEEKLRVKCYLYWPQTDHPLLIDTLGAGIEFVSEELILDSTDTILRVFTFTRHREKRKVYHIQYKGWPDHNVCNAKFVVGLVEYVQELTTKINLELQLEMLGLNGNILSKTEFVKSGPMIVHCSAGCGRTGTFCLIDQVIMQLKRESKSNQSNDAQDDDAVEVDMIMECLELLRSQRVSMVQTLDQFVFCYEAILAYLAEVG